MKRYGWAAVAVVMALVGCAQVRSMTGMDWQTLVDGDKGLENFNAIGDANSHPEGGAIVADQGKAGFLVTKNSYGDFELRAEFYAETHTNSAIFIRCPNPHSIASDTSYSFNISDIPP